MQHASEKNILERQINIDHGHRMHELKREDAKFHQENDHTVGFLKNGNPRLSAGEARRLKKVKADDRIGVLENLLRDDPELSQKMLVKKLKDLTHVSGVTARSDVRKFYENLTPVSGNGNGHAA